MISLKYAMISYEHDPIKNLLKTEIFLVSQSLQFLLEIVLQTPWRLLKYKVIA
jgi:hypothetical protein